MSTVNYEYFSLKLKQFFNLDDYINVYNNFFDLLLQKSQLPDLTVSFFLKNIFIMDTNNEDIKNKSDLWISQYIEKYSNDNIKMSCLFCFISDMDSSCKIKYYLMFIKYNKSFEDFKNVRLTPKNWGYSGSFVSIYYGWQKFIIELNKSIKDSNLLEHKCYLEEKINGLEKFIEHEKIQDLLTDTKE